MRQRILDTCGKLFRTEGFDETTIDLIVTRVELGLGWLRDQADVLKSRNAAGGIRADVSSPSETDRSPVPLRGLR